ncbi:hypothetical protein PC128_g1647 [Phytophthora cactorum]|nr:hypothetical protein PC120_g970 [Phytophthora cactorum]KAG3099542.1 hypothetical protein PC121_g1906 [Phytophthora cactorum]KAG3205009.1 hypothetical protein PC128_g1647 [Phytophthora cactorum]KAG4059040.1 hypothetical protein PC123_g6023 [Phytophthora cactorum]
MKALFGQIRADEVATGNLARVVKYPSYWSILVEFFADKKGLRNQDFGQSETPLPPFSAAGSDDDAAASDWGGDAASDGDIAVGEIHDDSSSDEADAAAVETDKDRHNSMKKHQKLDLPEAMVSMGTLIAKAMAGPEHVPDTANISVQLSEIQETQKKILIALENSANVNAQLLQFLQSKVD